MRLILVCSVLGVTLGLGAQPLPVRFDAGNPPFSYAVRGTPQGYYPRTILVAAEAAGLALQSEALPWTRALRALDEGEACVVGAYATPARRERYRVSEPLFRDRILVVGLKNRGLPPILEVQSLKGYKVGVIRGWVYGPLEPHLPQLERVEATYDDQLFLGMVQGNTDVVLALNYSAQYTMKRLGIDGVVLGELAQADEYMLCPKGGRFDEWVDRMNAALSRLQRSGELARIEALTLGVVPSIRR